MLEKRDELVNDLVNKVSEMMDRFNQRLRLNNLRLVERYIKAELHLLVHFVIRGADEQFVAHLQRAQGIGWSEESRQFGKFDAWKTGVDVLSEKTSRIYTKIKASESGTDSDQVAVLAEIVQLASAPLPRPILSVSSGHAMTFVKCPCAKKAWERRMTTV
jgi:hypothetical protein